MNTTIKGSSVNHRHYAVRIDHRDTNEVSYLTDGGSHYDTFESANEAAADFMARRKAKGIDNNIGVTVVSVFELALKQFA